MNGAYGRAALWKAAEALSDAVGGELSPRARRCAVRRDAPITLEAVRETPAWFRDGAERGRFARLVGAAGVSHAWRRTIDGAVLRSAGQAIGEAALDALLSLPEVMAPRIAAQAAERGDAGALERLGGAVLLSEAGHPPTLTPRLAAALRVGDAAAPCPPATAASARRIAEGVGAQLSAGT